MGPGDFGEDSTKPEETKITMIEKGSDENVGMKDVTSFEKSHGRHELWI